MNILTKLSSLTKLTENERILTEYIINHPEQILTMNAKELAHKTFVSQTTVYRLCNKLALSNFSDLKVLIAMQKDDFSKEKSSTDFNYPFYHHQTQYQIINNMEELYQQTIIATKNLLDLETLRLIVQEMYHAHSIAIYPSVGNINIAENFRQNMQEIGKPVEIASNRFDQHWSATIKKPGDLVFVISYLGKTPQIIDTVATLKEKGCTIVLISATYEEKISPLANYRLYLCSYENFREKIGSFSSRISLQYILDCLYSCYFERNFDQFLKFKIDNYID
ncbi:MurR/RpiR family transcriptional regulator [uncultured Thomasclavelia sp.]|uniref:MurR/RpiR family transcriptional regulator n=1 Tax=uncultured Thomasclavelia sp. TaxID=3025759 RepID=UPI0025FEDDAF|nr:MurR/RpiR family transcriptional regulator [uncultured Thomasclavelia sp.]